MRFVIYHEEKGYFMNGSSHLKNTERFSLDLQEARVFATRSAAKGAITQYFALAMEGLAPPITDMLFVIPVKLALVEE